MRNRVSWNAIFGTFLVFVSTSLLPVSPALAQIEGEASNQAIIYITDVNADTSHEVLAAFEDPQIESVLVFDETIGSTIQNKVEGEITPYVTTRWKRPANARYQSTYTGLKALATAKGGPGSTLSISQTKSVSNSYSCNYTVSVASISSFVGFNVTGA